jgi:antibiotic biosynthesis monooxygenase (ABM) superfamily enzyme
MGQSIMLIVANEPVPDREAEYNDWYTGKHIPLLFAFPGLKKASRYRRVGDKAECPKYLAVYEFDSPEDLAAFYRSQEFAAAVADFEEKWRGGGFERKRDATYELIKTWEKRPDDT